MAEAAKVIENSQRDVNIAFMNELSIIFDKLGIEPLAKEIEVQREYRIKLNKIKDVTDVDEVIFAVPHEKFKDITLKDLSKIYRNDKLVLIDIKGMFDRKGEKDLNYLYWRL